MDVEELRRLIGKTSVVLADQLQRLTIASQTLSTAQHELAILKNYARDTHARILFPYQQYNLRVENLHIIVPTGILVAVKTKEVEDAQANLDKVTASVAEEMDRLLK